MLTNLRRHHRGDVGYFALFSSFVGTYKVPTQGMTKGRYYDDGSVFTLDIRLWKRLGYIQAPIVLINGRVGCGKTSVVTKVALDEALLYQGRDNDFRIFMQIIRANNGVLENQELITALGAEAIDMSKHSVNLYDQEMGLEEHEQLEMLVDASEYVENKPISTERVIHLMAALKVFLARCKADPVYRENACDALFFKCLSTLTVEQVQDAIADSDRFRAQLIAKREKSREEDPDSDNPLLLPDVLDRLVQQGIQASDIELSEKRVKQVRNKCLKTLRRLGGADFGHTFTGQGSLATMMSQPVVAFNLSALNDRTIGFLQQVFWRYKTSAISRGDTRFLYSMEIHDENHRLWRYLSYARNMANYMKVIRSTDTQLWIITHRPGDYLALPAETRDIAINAMNEPEVFFWGAQSENVAKESQSTFHFTDEARRWMTGAEQGEFVMKVGKHPETRVEVILTDDEVTITDTEQASKSRLELNPAMAALID